jgi:hypothetical protein
MEHIESPGKPLATASPDYNCATFFLKQTFALAGAITGQGQPLPGVGYTSPFRRGSAGPVESSQACGAPSCQKSNRTRRQRQSPSTGTVEQSPAIFMMQQLDGKQEEI